MKAISRGRIGHPLLKELLWFVMSFLVPLKDKKLVLEFEEKFASQVGRNYCVAFPLARTGIHSVLKSLNLPKGTKILMPTVSIKGILDVVLHLGLEPIFIDLELDTFNWDEKQLQIALTNKPKVAIFTYLFGMVPNIDFILKELKKENVFVIEDFSQAWNATHMNRKAGQLGDISVYSTSSLKSIDTFGGGLVLTDDKEFYKKMKIVEKTLSKPNRLELSKKILLSLIKNVLTYPAIFNYFTFPALNRITKGNNKFERFVGARDQSPVSQLPIEWFQKFTSLQAKVGIYMLKYSKEADKKRILIGEKYLIGLNDKKIKNYGNSVFWQYIVIVKDFKQFKKELQNFRIDTGLTSLINLSELPNYKIIHGYPKAAKLYNNGAYIPCYSQISESNLERLIDVVGKSKQLVKNS